MEAAVSHFRAALEQNPEDLHLRVNVAMALHRLGRDEQAWSDLETVVNRKDAPPMTLLLAAEILE